MKDNNESGCGYEDTYIPRRALEDIYEWIKSLNDASCSYDWEGVLAPEIEAKLKKLLETK